MKLKKGTKSLRQACKDIFKGRGNAPRRNGNLPLRRILLVGARLDERSRNFFGNDGCLQERDRDCVISTIRGLRERNIPIDPNFEISICSPRPLCRQNFHARPENADIVVICYISNSPDGKAKTRFEPDIWYKNVASTGAKVVSVVGARKNDLKANHLMPEGGKFEPLSQAGGGHVLLVDKDYKRMLAPPSAPAFQQSGARPA
jgi:hypothetical protein